MEEVVRKRPIISAKERGQLEKCPCVSLYGIRVCVCASTWVVLKPNWVLP